MSSTPQTGKLHHTSTSACPSTSPQQRPSSSSPVRSGTIRRHNHIIEAVGSTQSIPQSTFVTPLLRTSRGPAGHIDSSLSSSTATSRRQHFTQQPAPETVELLRRHVQMERTASQAAASPGAARVLNETTRQPSSSRHRSLLGDITRVVSHIRDEQSIMDRAINAESETLAEMRRAVHTLTRMPPKASAATQTESIIHARKVEMQASHVPGGTDRMLSPSRLSMPSHDSEEDVWLLNMCGTAASIRLLWPQVRTALADNSRRTSHFHHQHQGRE